MSTQPSDAPPATVDPPEKTSLASRHRQILSKEEWEELKPIIKRLYIEENKTFHRISAILLETRGFAPTKRQFDFRVNHWGFRKNASRAGKVKTLQPNGSQSSTRKQNKIVKQSQRNEASTSREALREEEETSMILDAPGLTPPELVHSERGSPDFMSDSQNSPRPAPPQNTWRQPELALVSNKRVVKQIEDSSSTFNQGPTWTAVNSPGSPQLSQLLADLNVYALPADRNVSGYDNSSKVSGPGDIEYISGSDLFELTGTDHDTHGSENDYDCKERGLSRISSNATTYDGRSNVYKFDGVDAFFPSGEWMPPSPFHEIYPFPTISLNVTRVPVVLSDASVPALKARVGRLGASLANFNGSLPRNHPMILRSMENLANTCFELGEYTKSESWWKKVLAIREEFEGSESPKALYAAVKLMKVIHQASGSLRLDELERMERSIEWRLGQSSLPPDDDLVLEFMLHRAERLGVIYAAENVREAERLYRQMLQIRLNRLGPKDPKTLFTMGRLGWALAYRLSEFESSDAPDHEATIDNCIRLSHSSVELYSEGGDILEPSGQELASLMLFVLRSLHHFDEAIHLAQSLFDRCKEVLGESHQASQLYLQELGGTSRLMGQFDKSVGLFQKLLEFPQDGNKYTTAWRMEELGKGLRSLRRYEEAIIWFKKVYDECFELYGTLNEDTKAACYQLGECYSQLKQYDTAVQIYNQFAEKVRTEGSNDHKFLAEIAIWIRDVEDPLRLESARQTHAGGFVEEAEAEDP